MYAGFSKRLLDVSVALLALLVLAPVILITALVVRTALGSPVLFPQLRPGRHGRPFRIFKFRTMRIGSGEQNDAARLTKVGRWLRALSLDELPELLNVLKGEMSLVGPRPLLMQYCDRYTPEQARRHEVKPGITGWAQINGRNTLSWDEKFRLDVWYVDNLSLSVDLKILALTCWKTLTREGITPSDHASVAEFRGSPQP